MEHNDFSEAKSLSGSQIHLLLRNPKYITIFTRSCPIPRPCVTFRIKLIVYRVELLASRPTYKLEDYSLSAVRDCLFNVFVATLLL